MHLAIPSPLTAFERVFSAAGNVVTKKRNGLGDNTAVDALVCRTLTQDFCNEIENKQRFYPIEGSPFRFGSARREVHSFVLSWWRASSPFCA